MIVVFWGDGIVTKEAQIAEMRELLVSNKSARSQQEVALHVLKAKLPDLNPKHNANRYQERVIL